MQMLAKADKMEAFYCYVLKHVAEGGNNPGRFTSSMWEMRSAFATLEKAGLVTTDAPSKPFWPEWADWNTPQHSSAHARDQSLIVGA
jgi:hypothetical protein